jgi:hypothetical protein
MRTKTVESATTTVSVTVATKLPRPTPDFEPSASENDAGLGDSELVEEKGPVIRGRR